MKSIKELQEDWFNINAPFGKELGYPDCCIKEFCAQPPALLKRSVPSKDDQRRYEAGCIDGVFTGFIPCIRHAKMVLKKEISLYDLIVNRNKDFPLFPITPR